MINGMGAGRRWLAAVGLVLAVPFLAAAGDDMVVVTREYLNQLQDGQKRLREMEQNIPDARISRPEAKIYRPPPAAAGAAPALPAETRLLMEQKTVDSNLDSWERQGKLRDANKFIESADCDACGKPPPATSDGCLSCAADLPPPAPSERWEEVTEAEKRVYARGGRRRGRPAYPEEEPALLINDIVLRGDDADEFRFALRDVADARGRKLGARGIKMVLARVQSRIISAGYVTTRVYAEKQDLSGGTLVLTLKPGYLHEARLSEGSDTRISLYSNLPVRDGGLLNIRDIEQGLENFRRIPSAATTMELEPGTREGESDLVVNRDQHRRFRFRASADNAGQKATGRYQGRLTFNIDNLLGMSDQFYATMNRGLEFGRERNANGYGFFYSIPLGYNFFSASFDHYKYSQEVAGLSSNLLYEGETNRVRLDYQRVVHRDSYSRTSVGAALTWNASDNYFGGQRLDIQRRRQAGAEVAVNHRQYIGRLTLDLGLRYHQGIRMLGALKAPEEAIGEGSAEARLLTWNFRLLAPFSVGEENFRFISSAWGQFALNKLISQDRFYLGGRYTVRGYTGDVNLAADSGYVFRNEVGWLIKETRAELYAGLDFGQVWGGPVADYLPGKALAGAVLGYRGAFKTFDYDLFVSVPVLKPRGFAAPKWVLGFNLGYEF